MTLLVVAATEKEILPFLDFLKIERKDNFTTCSYKKLQINILITGIGMTATAYGMGKFLAGKKYDYALNLGIAGCFDRAYKIGEIFNITRDCFSELGAEDGKNFLPLNEINLLKNDNFFFNKSVKIENNSKINNTTLNSLKQAVGITVNTIHGNNESIERIKKMFNPTTESMEGAAFLNICLLENIPSVQVRSISNYVDERSKANWNIQLAIENLNQTAIKILDGF